MQGCLGNREYRFHSKPFPGDLGLRIPGTSVAAPGCLWGAVMENRTLLLPCSLSQLKRLQGWCHTCGLSPHQVCHTSHMSYDSVQTLSTWGQHQIPQDGPPSPHTPVSSSGCHLCFPSRMEELHRARRGGGAQISCTLWVRRPPSTSLFTSPDALHTSSFWVFMEASLHKHG